MNHSGWLTGSTSSRRRTSAGRAARGRGWCGHLATESWCRCGRQWPAMTHSEPENVGISCRLAKVHSFCSVSQSDCTTICILCTGASSNESQKTQQCLDIVTVAVKWLILAIVVTSWANLRYRRWMFHSRPMAVWFKCHTEGRGYNWVCLPSMINVYSSSVDYRLV